MSEDAKKNIAGALTARPNSDDQKLSPLPSPAPAVPPKKVIIKSADMIPDMQKEAVDIAVAVSFDNFLLFFCGSSFWILFLGLVVLAALCHKVLTILRIIQAFEKYNVEKDVAEQIKKEFDKRHGPTWHCIVGRNFGNSLFVFFPCICQ